MPTRRQFLTSAAALTLAPATLESAGAQTVPDTRHPTPETRNDVIFTDLESGTIELRFLTTWYGSW